MSHQPELMPDQPSPDQSAREAERAEYLDRLRRHLRDPDFRAIEGFPIGDEDAILALSDPPYYTACPNPFLPEIIQRWQAERAQLRQELGLPDDSHDNGNGNPQPPNPKSPISNLQSPISTLPSPPVYHREPFASDVSEGKNDPIYNAHSYHTKVPHKAVMRYILHYTDPGDIVFDGFCGTGMTGVAAQLCGDRQAVEDLGYHVDEHGRISDSPAPQGGGVISRLGARKSVLVDLSPAATFIAYNYNTPVDVTAFEWEAKRILREVEEECGWMYETWHPHCDHPQRVKGRINYTIWSDVFVCPQCGEEMLFWNVALDRDDGKVRSSFPCPGCGAEQTKRSLERVWETVYDDALGQTIRRIKQVPVLINHSVGRKRHEKAPDSHDLNTIQRIEEIDIPYPFPTNRWPDGEKTGSLLSIGIAHTHHLYTRRNLWVLAAMWHRLAEVDLALLVFCFTASLRASTLLASIKFNYYFHGGGGPITPGIKGTYYVTSLVPEIPVLKSFKSRVRAIKRAFGTVSQLNLEGVAMEVRSSSDVSALSTEAIDYIFVDPPFGSNLMYSELNFLWEAWLRVLTNSGSEAVINRIQRKGLPEYQHLMEHCFCEFYRVLKPAHWMTVEFHNSQNRVWNAIQEALLRAGFVVADVRTFNKRQGTFNQVTATGAVKQDLIISAYKPRTSFERRFRTQAGTPDGAWDFIRQHLAQLPVVVRQDGALEVIAERQSYLLFDRMVAFHIQRGATVPLSAAEFYAGLRERFAERDGMFFLPDQVPEYDRARLEAAEIAQLALFVSDEKSTIQWLRQQLDTATGGRPQTYQDLQPQFLRQLHQARHEALPELSEMLEQNFLQDEAGHWYVPDPTKSGDLEKLRQRALLREFAEYVEGSGRLRRFRTEAVRAGFADAWHCRDYATIVQVAVRLPERVLQEDPDLLMYYDNATLRMD